MPRKPKKIIYHYQDFSEVMKPREVALLLGVSLPKFWEWIHSGKTPMGVILEGVHYYKAGYEYRIIKDRVCELFGILPKELARPKEGQACGKS